MYDAKDKTLDAPFPQRITHALDNLGATEIVYQEKTEQLNILSKTVTIIMDL